MKERRYSTPADVVSDWQEWLSLANDVRLLFSIVMARVQEEPESEGRQKRVEELRGQLKDLADALPECCQSGYEGRVTRVRP